MPRHSLPSLLKRTAARITRKSGGKLDRSAGFAIATHALQAAGYLRKGRNTLTKKGTRKSRSSARRARRGKRG